jgi:hypothetical protein
VKSGRAVDVLNDTTTRYLEIEQVRFFQRTGSELVAEVPRALLVKNNVHLVLLVSEDRSNERRVFFAAQERRTHTAVISLPTVVVKGELHVKSAADPQGFLSIQAGSFIPVTDATVFGHAPDTAPIISSVVLINKDAITSLAINA